VIERTPDDLLVKREVAAKLKRSMRTIDQWMASGRLPYIRFGRSIYFKWSDVIAKLDRHRVN